MVRPGLTAIVERLSGISSSKVNCLYLGCPGFIVQAGVGVAADDGSYRIWRFTHDEEILDDIVVTGRRYTDGGIVTLLVRQGLIFCAGIFFVRNQTVRRISCSMIYCRVVNRFL